jgi:hypothetical protein
MFTKIIIALTAALVITTSLVSVADAQRASRQHQAVQPFTDAERNWFDAATGRDDGMPRQ